MGGGKGKGKRAREEEGEAEMKRWLAVLEIFESKSTPVTARNFSLPCLVKNVPVSALL